MTNNNDNTVDLSIFLRRIYRWRHPIVATSLVLCALLYYALSLQIPRYAATSKMIYQSKSTSLSGNMGALAAFAGISMDGGSGDVSSYLSDIVFTRDVLLKIAQTPWKTTKLSKDTSLAMTLDKWWKWKPDTTAADWREILEENIIGTLSSPKAGYIRYEKDPASGLILLTTEFEDPRISADINEYLIAELNNYVQHKLHSKASQNTQFIKERMEEVKQDLSHSENAYYSFRKANVVRDDPLVSLEEERLQRKVTINREMYLQFLKQYEMSRIDELKETPVLDILEHALRPRYPSRPNRKLFMAACFPAAFVFSTVLFYFIGILIEWRRRLRPVA